MDWLQILFLFLANGSLIVWFRTESRNDWRHMDNQVKAIQDEVKSFHLSLKDFNFVLQKQDFEFKARMEKQDADFKAHMMQYHKGAK